MKMIVTMGVHLGQRRHETALCVVEQELRKVGEGREEHYLVRLLDRLPMGTSYPDVARRVTEVAERVEERTGTPVELFVNATGLGTPVVELLGESRSVCWTWAVYFTHGDRRTEDTTGGERVVTLGKAYLVTRLQTLLQLGRLHLPRTAEAQRLADELREYEVRVDADANDRYGAFRVGTQDELVNALGMAVQTEHKRSVYPSGGEGPMPGPSTGLSSMSSWAAPWW